MERLPTDRSMTNVFPKDVFPWSIPKDVQSIIYRYIFDSSYDAVVQDYIDRWLKHIRWSDKESSFVIGFRDYHMANYRDINDSDFETQNIIYGLYDFGSEAYAVGTLPDNYWYSIADMKKYILSLHGVL